MSAQRTTIGTKVVYTHADSIQEQTKQKQHEAQHPGNVFRYQREADNVQGKIESEDSSAEAVFRVPITSLLLVLDNHFIRYSARYGGTNWVAIYDKCLESHKNRLPYLLFLYREGGNKALQVPRF